jgi:DNA primase
MASLIPQGFIDDLLDRLDIVEVVDSRVKLKKTGKNFSACCPFHDEKSPSFTVSQDKQFYYCFGCGASGNAVGFLMEYERLEFPQAVENLARLAGLEVPRQASNPAADRRAAEKKQIFSLLEKADEFYQTQLRQHSTRMDAVQYLKARGLSGDIARAYGIGYAPPGWDNLLQACGQKPDDQKRLLEGGMFIEREGNRNLYDRFRHRIMFPIRDTRGRVIGFGGRVLGDDKPKYLNSPETPVFHKGQELYGLHEARQAYKEIPRLLVVEGYMDVVALAQFGIQYGVATLGTACGEDNLRRAFRYTTEVVFCFDGDAAGRAAGRRALENCLPVMEDGRRVKFLFLPDGEDPDTLIRQIGEEKFTRLIELAVPLEDFLFDAVADGLDTQNMEGRARLSKLAAPLLDKLPKGVFRELMFANLANRTGLGKDTLMELIKELPKAQNVLSPAETNKPRPAPRAQRTKKEGEQAPSRAQTTQPAEQNAPPEYHYEEMPVDEDYVPNYEQEGLGHYDAAPYSDAPDQPATQSDARSRYLMPPNLKIIALTLSQPSLAAELEDYQFWEAQNDPALQLFARLVKILQQRPHYNMAQIIGFWSASYGEEETRYLTEIAGNDLVQTTKILAKAEEDEQAGYDLATAFADTLASLHRKIKQVESAKSLDKLKNSDLTQLSKEEKRQLVADALQGKDTNGP